MLTVRKIEGGYVVDHNGIEQVAHADHVANLIIRFWPDVLEHLKDKLTKDAKES